MKRPFLAVPVSLALLLFITLLPHRALSQSKESAPTVISGGAEASSQAPKMTAFPRQDGSPIDGPALAFTPGIGFPAYNFDDNITETGGFIFIPPDPCGAAGQDRVLAVVNVGIECRDKTGLLIFRDALRDFFSPLGAATLGTFTFDPKVVYDHYEDRFVVVTLERWLTALGDPSNESRILVAVSKTSTPATATAADWWYMAIDSKTSIGGVDHWADYPGFEVDEEAIYITNNMFDFTVGGYGGVRLWIIDKGTVGGFYSGGAAAWNIYNPVPAGFVSTTTMPALVFGAGGAGAGVGTYLLSYSSLTAGGVAAPEFIQIVRVDNPLGAPVFTAWQINVGDLEDVGGGFGFPAIPDAPQSGTATLIEVNDSRALDAVWRNNSLWLTTTINPNAANDPVNTGSATAHWFRFDDSGGGAPVLVDQGNIGGEDIAPNTWTFFPSVAVNRFDDAKFGFSASAQTIFAGAYYAGRQYFDPAGTVGPSGAVQVGLDFYQRTFGGPRNRWGDYTGAAVDPSDDTTFWIFNEYAELRGTGAPPEDGRWGTAWASCLVEQDWGDAPDPTYPTLLASNGARHVIVPQVFLGNLIDPEPDGQPDPLASGDDTNGLPDEDGVAFVTPLVPGAVAQIDVTASIDGWFDFWIDYNQNGAWEAVELVYSNIIVVGLNPLNFPVPAGATTGNTFARARFNLNGPLPPTGPAPDGEVEDYLVVIEEPQVELDFGDAPDQPYPTLLANNGARHTIDPNVFMGLLIDSEADGQPSANADRDDLAGIDDEDGVVFTSPLDPTKVATVDVTVSVDGLLDAWIDFDNNGVWNAADQIYASVPVVAGINNLAFNVPGTSAPAFDTYARFRFSLGGGLAPTGLAPDGEVEDYEVHILEDVVTDASDNRTPTEYALNNPVPNPFNPTTTITFALPKASHVELTIFDVRGQVVATLLDEDHGPGIFSVQWEGLDNQRQPVASGVYLCRIHAGSFVETKRMVLIK
jgi:hypothetical protein